MAPLWQYLIPKYGNFGGPGWTCGAMMSSYDEVDWSVQPADSLDKCFHDHDKKYQTSIRQERNKEISQTDMYRAWIEADRFLIRDINNIPVSPKEWTEPPIKNSNAYAWFYRKLAIYVFIAKVWLYGLKHT